MEAWQEIAVASRALLLALPAEDRVALYAQAALSPREVAVVERYVLERPPAPEALAEAAPKGAESLSYLDYLGDLLGTDASEAEAVCESSRTDLEQLGPDEQSAVLQAALVVAMARIGHFGRDVI